MDLNFFYSQHQISMMRAAATGDRRERSEHLAAAACTASRIQHFQLSQGAPASSGWSPAQEPLGSIASFAPGSCL